MTHKKSLNKMLKKSLRKSRKSRKPCVYGTNQYGCCNKKPSVRKTKRCIEASKRRSSPCKYGEDENGCCNKRPTIKYRKSCRKSRRIRKSIESRIKLEKMLNDKHLMKKIIKSLTKSKRKSRKPQHVNRPTKQANFGLNPNSWFTNFKDIIKNSIKNRQNSKKHREENTNTIKEERANSRKIERRERKQERERKRERERVIYKYKTGVDKIVNKHKTGLNILYDYLVKNKKQPLALAKIPIKLLELNKVSLFNIQPNITSIDKSIEVIIIDKSIEVIKRLNLQILNKELYNKEQISIIINIIKDQNMNFFRKLVYTTKLSNDNPFTKFIPILGQQYETFYTKHGIILIP
jgi:hypothetical protein